MDVLKEFTFEGHTIRGVSYQESLWIMAVDICKSLYIENSSYAYTRLPSREKMYIPAGLKNHVAVNKDGMFSLSFLAEKNVGKDFCSWASIEIVPFLTSNKFVVLNNNVEKRLSLLEEQILELKYIVEKKSNKKKILVKPSLVKNDERHQLVSMMRKYANNNGIAHNRVWNRFYDCYKVNFGVDIWRLSTHEGMKPIDYLEKSGSLSQALNLFITIFSQYQLTKG